MSRPESIAIIGCGWAGRRHAQACAELGVQVAWAVDVDDQRAASLPGYPGRARVATDYAVALSDPAVDAVDICLPHSLHAQVAVEAAAAGKHILCEKPMAASLAEADRMIEAADRAGVVLMIAEVVRFIPAYQQARELLDSGAIGKPALAQCIRETDLARSFLEERPWFLSQEQAGGGIMMSGGIHDFETLRMLVGEIASVQALRAPQRFPRMEGDDTSVALVRFQTGAVGTLVESFVMKSLTTASGQEAHVLRIDGDLGSLSVMDGTTIRLFSERVDLMIAGRPAEHSLLPPAADPFALEIEHFLDCVRSGREPITSGRDQRRPLEAVLAAYTSMATGQVVELPSGSGS